LIKPAITVGLFLKGEIKGRSLPGKAFSPDPASVAVDDPADRAQPQAGAWELLPVVYALEG
jgi:hypothetical protein